MIFFFLGGLRRPARRLDRKASIFWVPVGQAPDTAYLGNGATLFKGPLVLVRQRKADLDVASRQRVLPGLQNAASNSTPDEFPVRLPKTWVDDG